ncbi:MAG: sigma-54 dependent transcriptional regulator [Verrucomicrobiota bacterium]
MQDSDLATLGILIVEDEPLLRKQMMADLEKQGADVTGADTLQRAKKLLENLGFDFAFLDVNLPDGRGTDLLKENNFPANTGVIVMTAEGAVSGAVEAMRLGAIDYLVKPFDLAELPLVIARARRAKQSARLDEHRRSDESRAGGGFFFGTRLAALEKQLQKILVTDRRLGQDLPPVLIEGETGTGKTTIARWLHREGPRAAEPLVEVNCSALPEGLVESELFGHERGAFTDARTARMGLFEAANGGTLFLDEAPSLPLPLQAKVLKAIEDRKIRRVGGNKETRIDVRIIAATNRELKSLVAQGQFREDLFHRLDLFRLCIPPLRERGHDILKLAEMILEQLSRKHRVPVKSIHPLGEKNLLAYPWPGNVRELAHELERAIVFEEENTLKFEHLCRPDEQTPEAKADSNDWFNERFVFPAEGFSLDEAILRVIRHALKQSDDNVSAAARLLGVSRDYVRYRLAGQKSE